ncbi:hypothetical protein PTSG_00448 [Salpingoeca rosetta]|uniref:Sulfatase N-terminal domain-containing protein n=1 Tax=Salpingoeca rosetta (strain ATCC 50818 / BSB-021) TaxID=946362 RepID=F2TWI3_SALR5|nr:uncharacterized protein PTSG_00448 [Salpingoeca rosetta]EGD72429.1 hypothetical protein PTSG_00448 [Salpingoeca rosetta]|eukprot:XP_004998998.1 hypothetical protein PTSG_00448 [Salpingoeca rosetta]
MMTTRRVVVGLLLFVLMAAGHVHGKQQKQPHIIFFLTDDLGWNAPSFHNNEIITPTLHHLHANGVELYSHYTYMFCSPTRASFLTGRFPYKHEMTNTNLLPPTRMLGLDLSYTTLADKLKQANYSTHHIGKWHLGMYKKEYTPRYRGFDTTFGFLTGGENHYTQRAFVSPPAVDLWDEEAPAYGMNGTWTGKMFTDAALDIIRNNAQLRNATGDAPPLFIYFALHDVHAPTQSPVRLAQLYNFTGDDAGLKSTFYGMISGVDEAVRNVTDALKAAGMWNDTLLVWTSDNGSPTMGSFNGGCKNVVPDSRGGACMCGSNYPLRGSKHTNFEGGVRTPTFVSGPVLPAHMRGKRLDGLMHVCDWYSTLCSVAGVDPADPGGIAPLDAIDMWPYISGAVSESPRDFIVHDHRMFTSNITGAIRKGDWKLFVDPDMKWANWFGFFAPNASVPDPPKETLQCPRESPCLFNIKKDMTEQHNVAKEHPLVVMEMLALFDSLNNEYHPPKDAAPTNSTAFYAYVNAHNGFLGPFMSPYAAPEDDGQQ